MALHHFAGALASKNFRGWPRKLAVILLLCLPVSLGLAMPKATNASQQLWRACTAREVNTVIKGCTQVIGLPSQTRMRLARAHFARARALAKKGDVDAALADFDQAIALAPRYAEAYNERGIVYYVGKADKARALADFDKALSLKPDFAHALESRGWLRLYDGEQARAFTDFDLAITFLDRALKAKPKSAELLIHRGSAHVGKGNYDRAIADYSDALRTDPTHDEAYLSRGNAHFRKGDHDRAIADFDDALRLQPDFAQAYHARGYTFNAKKDYDRAIADLTAALRLNPKSPGAYFDRASVYRFGKADAERALADLDRAIEFNPNHFLAYLLRGQIHRERKDFERALAEYGRAILINPADTNAYEGRATVYAQMGERQRAVADLDEAIRLLPPAAPNSWRGRLYWFRSIEQLTDSPASAIADATKALDAQPDFAPAYHARALAFQQKGDFDAALADIETLLRIEPARRSDHLLFRGQIFLNKKLYPKAIADADEAIRLDPGNLSAFFQRATVLYVGQRDYKRVLADLDEVMRLLAAGSKVKAQGLELGTLALAYQLRALSYAHLGDGGAVKENCEAVLKLDLDKLEPRYRASVTSGCGQAFNLIGDYDRALAYYNEAIAAAPDAGWSASASAGRADVFVNAEEFDNAIAAAEEAINADPKEPSGYVNRGFALLGKGDTDRALADFSQAIRLKPDEAYDAYHGRGSTYVKKKEYARAIDDFDRAIALDPKRLTARFHRGEANRERGDYDQAVADYNQVIALADKAPNSHYGLGLIALWRGQYDEAVRQFAESLRQDPRHGLARAYLAQAQLRAGKLDEALLEAEAALKAGQKRGAAFAARAAVFFALGKTGEAIDDFNEAIKLGESKPSAYAGRAEAYEKQGRAALALADYQKAADLEATDPLERKARVFAGERLAALEASKKSAPEVKAPAPIGRRVALVIGMGAYRHAPMLPNPTRDARAVADAFRHLGFSEVIEVADVDRAGLERAVKDFSDRAASADWAVVFYAGHGMQIDGLNYLIPIDAKLEHVRHVPAETLGLDRIMAAAAEAKKLGLVILDSCRNNPFLSRMDAGGRTQRALAGGLAAVEPVGGQLVVFATRDGHLAADGDDEHSPFTHALLYHIDEPGIDIRILFSKVRDTVLKQTKNAQEPFTYGSLPGEPLYFKG